MSSPPPIPLACYCTFVGDELSFRMLTPGDRSDLGDLPPVRACRRPPVSVLLSECDEAPPVNVCAGHRALAQDAREAQRERCLLLPSGRPPAAPQPPPASASGPQAAE